MLVYFKCPHTHCGVAFSAGNVGDLDDADALALEAQHIVTTNPEVVPQGLVSGPPRVAKRAAKDSK